MIHAHIPRTQTAREERLAQFYEGVDDAPPGAFLAADKSGWVHMYLREPLCRVEFDEWHWEGAHETEHQAYHIGSGRLHRNGVDVAWTDSLYQVPVQQATRDPKPKHKPTLLPPAALEAISELLSDSARSGKHPPTGWRSRSEDDLCDKLQRHYLALRRGEERCEDGNLHAVAIAANALMLLDNVLVRMGTSSPSARDVGGGGFMSDPSW